MSNVFCVGRNYREHAAELGNEVPDAPMLFLKPTHAVIAMDGQSIDLPGDLGAVHYEAEVVLRIGRTPTSGDVLDGCIDGLAIGLDLTLRDVQTVLKQKGFPWLAAKGFRHAAPISAWMPYPGWDTAKDISFSCKRDGQLVQSAKMSQMVHVLPELLVHCQDKYGLGAGDLIFTGTPAGAGEIADGDHFQLFWHHTLVGEARFSLRETLPPAKI